HVKQGNKTSTGERFEFYELLEDGKEVPQIKRQIVSELNEKLEELIGLTRDQFQQIIMLPQGEFRKLLTSDTENKEKILRRIFKTERYNQMNDVMKQYRDRAEGEFQAKKDVLAHHVQAIAATVADRQESSLYQILQTEHYNTDQVAAAMDDAITMLAEDIQENE